MKPKHIVPALAAFCLTAHAAALWQDANGNGVSDPGEIKSLAEWNIIGLSCRSQTHSTGIPFHPSGVILKDGSTRPSYDWLAPRCLSGESRP